MNYRENKVSGECTSWRRAYRVEINNSYQSMPNIVFHEQDKITLPDGTVVDKPMTGPSIITEDFSDPTKEITLIHPETGAVIGTAHYQDIYVILFSLYMQLAAARDTPAPVEAPAG